MSGLSIKTSDFVDLHLSTSKNHQFFGERRFPKDLTVAGLKAKLELMTGASSSTMQLEAYDKNDKLICKISNEDALLGSFPIDSGMRLHIIDPFVIKNEFENADVEHFKISDEQYAKKSDSVRAFLQKNKCGKYNEEKTKQMEEAEQKRLEAIAVGSRCKVTVTGNPTRLGAVKYKGKVDGLNGTFIGVQYDEPLGKHNGTFNGKAYFECPDKYGAFVKPQNVECGDFPEEIFDLDEEL